MTYATHFTLGAVYALRFDVLRGNPSGPVNYSGAWIDGYDLIAGIHAAIVRNF